MQIENKNLGQIANIKQQNMYNDEFYKTVLSNYYNCGYLYQKFQLCFFTKKDIKSKILRYFHHRMTHAKFQKDTYF